MMKRVVVTGLGIVSAIGNNAEGVCISLRQGQSGIVFVPQMQERGFKCCLFGPVKGLDTGGLKKKAARTMSDVAKYAAVAALEAIQDARLGPEALQGDRCGVVVGTGLGGINEATRIENMWERGMPLTRAGANGIVKVMNCTASGNLASYLGARGRSLSVSTACCTGLDNLGYAYELLQAGVLDLCIAGSAEEDSWRYMGASFDNFQESPRSWNDRPSEACRPYDRDREGFVLASGAGILVLETLDHAKARGARIIAEILGYGSNNDGEDMFRPNGRGLRQALKQCMAPLWAQGIHHIDLLNPHGTGTHVGDEVESGAIREVLGTSPMVSATKGLTGHALGAAAAIEAVITLLMLTRGFVSPTANLENIAPECAGINHARTLLEVPMETAMTFNSGLGGTNAAMVFKKRDG